MAAGTQLQLKQAKTNLFLTLKFGLSAKRKQWCHLTLCRNN